MLRRCVKVIACALVLALAVSVSQEGRIRLKVTNGIVSVSRVWLFGTAEMAVRCVPVSSVKGFDMRLGHHLPNKGLREELVITLVDGSEFFREGVGKYYNAELIERLELAMRGNGECIVDCFNDYSILLSLVFVVMSMFGICAMFGKLDYAKRIIRQMWNR